MDICCRCCRLNRNGPPRVVQVLEKVPGHCAQITVIAPYSEGLRTLPQTDVISAIGDDYGNRQGAHGLLFTTPSPIINKSRKMQSEGGTVHEETDENRDVCSCCAKTLPRENVDDMIG